MRTRIRGLGVAALAALALAACAPFRSGGPVLQGAPNSAADAPVRPGDQVVLQIWNEPTMSGTFPVGAGGELILPRLGTLVVTGHSATSLQDSVRTAYAQYLRNPSVRITVERRVGISGAIRSPGVYMVDLTRSLPDVIAMAGGLVESADPDNIVIERGTERLRYRVNDRSVFVVAQLLSGDQISVGHKNFIQRNPMAVVTTAIPLLGYVITVIIPALRDL